MSQCNETSPGKILLKFEIIEGRFIVTVKEASIPQDSDEHFSTFYVQLNLSPSDREDIRQTRCVQSRSRPFFNQSFPFPVPTGNTCQQQLIISLFRESPHLGVTWLMGRSTLNLQRLVERCKTQFSEGWCNLSSLNAEDYRNFPVQSSVTDTPGHNIYEEPARLLADMNVNQVLVSRPPRPPPVPPRRDEVIRHEMVILKHNKGYGFDVHGSCPVKVRKVTGGTPAHKSGLREGDIICKINNWDAMDITSEEVNSVLSVTKPSLSLTVIRPSSLSRGGSGANTGCFRRDILTNPLNSKDKAKKDKQSSNQQNTADPRRPRTRSQNSHLMPSCFDQFLPFHKNDQSPAPVVGGGSRPDNVYANDIGGRGITIPRFLEPTRHFNNQPTYESRRPPIRDNNRNFGQTSGQIKFQDHQANSRQSADTVFCNRSSRMSRVRQHSWNVATTTRTTKMFCNTTNKTTQTTIMPERDLRVSSMDDAFVEDPSELSADTAISYDDTTVLGNSGSVKLSDSWYDNTTIECDSNLGGTAEGPGYSRRECSERSTDDHTLPSSNVDAEAPRAENPTANPSRRFTDRNTSGIFSPSQSPTSIPSTPFLNNPRKRIANFRTNNKRASKRCNMERLNNPSVQCDTNNVTLSSAEGYNRVYENLNFGGDDDDKENVNELNNNTVTVLMESRKFSNFKIQYLSEEEKYSSYLKTCVALFSQPMRHHLLTPHEHNCLFQNFEKLTKLAEFHHASLKNDFHLFGCSNVTLSFIITSSLQKLRLSLEHYKTYLNGLDTAMVQYAELMKRQDIINYLNNSSSDIDLKNLLVMPKEYLAGLINLLSWFVQNIKNPDRDVEKLKDCLDEYRDLIGEKRKFRVSASVVRSVRSGHTTIKEFGVL